MRRKIYHEEYSLNPKKVQLRRKNKLLFNGTFISVSSNDKKDNEKSTQTVLRMIDSPERTGTLLLSRDLGLTTVRSHDHSNDIGISMEYFDFIKDGTRTEGGINVLSSKEIIQKEFSEKYLPSFERTASVTRAQTATYYYRNQKCNSITPNCLNNMMKSVS
jgi:hypothetical protein